MDGRSRMGMSGMDFRSPSFGISIDILGSITPLMANFMHHPGDLIGQEVKL